MIKDTLLICSVVLCFVLLYRIYVISSKINNLEEKINVLDTFSQSIFNYVSNKEEQEKQQAEEIARKQEQENVITYSNNQTVSNKELPKVEENSESESENDNESQIYNVVQPIHQFEDKLTENFESKEVISEMVSQLKETLIQNNMETVDNEIEEMSELKEDTNELFNLLNNANVIDLQNIETNKVMDESKKKEDELMKLRLQDLKDLAKKKNIKIMDQKNKPKKKEILVKEILTCL